MERSPGLRDGGGGLGAAEGPPTIFKMNSAVEGVTVGIAVSAWTSAPTNCSIDEKPAFSMASITAESRPGICSRDRRKAEGSKEASKEGPVSVTSARVDD